MINKSDILENAKINKEYIFKNRLDKSISEMFTNFFMRDLLDDMGQMRCDTTNSYWRSM